jgi:hypothetical protein
MINEKEKYEELEERMFGIDAIDVPFDDSTNDFDESLEDIDFSEFKGKEFKKAFSSANKKIDRKSQRKKKKPLSKDFAVNKRATITGGEKKLSKVIVPDNQKVIVEGVSKFILSQSPKDIAIKNIGYYKGEKLTELILTFNNNSLLDFDTEIFNPSAPLDYLYATSLNLNDKIEVAGGFVSYSDVLFNLLANPTLIVNAKFVFAGALLTQQKSQPLIATNKQITGVAKISPINLDLKVDNMQVANDIVYFNVMDALNRPFIPDGMDVFKYKVLAGMTVTMAFFYKQISLKRVLLEEARNSKILL